MAYINTTIKQKSFQFHEYYVFDGIDGIGKTTQINLLQNYLERQGLVVFRTRSIGGSENSDCDKLRKFIVNSNFTAETEEILLASAAWLNLKEVVNKITEHGYPHKSSKKLVILQDRGVLSHLTYAQCRGFSRSETLEIHHKNIKGVHLLRAKNIVLMPLNIDVILERVKNRGEVGLFHQKYEKEEFQLNVLNRMIIELSRRGQQGIRSLGDFEIIKINATDEALDIHQQVLKCLNLK